MQTIAAVELKAHHFKTTVVVVLISMGLDSGWSGEFTKLFIVICEELNCCLRQIKGYIE